MQLKHNTRTNDPRLGRVIQFDDRSRNFPLRAVLPAVKPRSFTWKCPVVLDQGDFPYCVGYSWTQDLLARPKASKDLGSDFPLATYQAAQKLDDWPGEAYEGTSVLAGAKALAANGHLKEYRWGFGLQDLIDGIGHHGPAVIGINWYNAMFKPDAKGIVHVAGSVAGGHAILCNGVNIKDRLFRLHNSWGNTWGVNGECFISFEDMDRLLKEDGESVFGIKK